MSLPLGRSTVALDLLHEAPENPRQISPERFELLKYTMTAMPWLLEDRPPIATPDGKMIAGNMRLRAARELGWESLEISVRDLTPAEQREVMTLDNQGFGEYVPDELAALVKLHVDEAGDVALMGFTQPEADGLLALLNDDPVALGGLDSPGDPDTVIDRPDPDEIVTNIGDMWALGPHRVLCGDSRDRDDLDRLYLSAGPSLPIGCVLTDPPYGIALAEQPPMARGYSPPTEHRPIIGDGEPFDATLLARYLAGVPEQFWFGADYYRRTLSDNDMDGAWLVWDKRSETSDEGIGSGFELIWSRQAHKRMLLRHYFFGCFGKEARGRLGPNQKPTPLLAEILDRWAPAGCIVADPFLGTGSTLIACERTGRVCYGLEIDPASCDVIVARWEQITGRTAELAQGVAT